MSNTTFYSSEYRPLSLLKTIFSKNYNSHSFYSDTNNRTKVSLTDALLGLGECSDELGFWTVTALFLSGLFWTFRLMKVFYHFVQFWDIKMFFNTALKIDDVSINCNYVSKSGRMFPLRGDQIRYLLKKV